MKKLLALFLCAMMLLTSAAAVAEGANIVWAGWSGEEEATKDIFQKMMGSLWIEHNIADKILFGSNNPRFRPARIKRGLESLPLSKITMDKLLGGNAANFLGLEG